MTLRQSRLEFRQLFRKDVCKKETRNFKIVFEISVRNNRQRCLRLREPTRENQLNDRRLWIGFMAKTNYELITRLKDPEDNEAWSEFVSLYEPMITRIAMKLGMTRENAADATQDVLFKLLSVVVKWTPRSQVGSFRSWLNQVARNLMIRMLQNRKLQIEGTGQTDVHRILVEQPSRDSNESRYYDLEFRRHVFAYVLKKIQPEFRSETWDAFWRSTIEDVPVTRVAHEGGISVTSVYVSRCRVMKRIKSEVKRLVDSKWDSFVDLAVER